jgi:hypothetical protein
MGIIDNYRKANRNYGQYNEPNRKDTSSITSKILDLSYMQKMIDNVMNHHTTETPKGALEHHRRWSYVQSFRLQNMLGRVDTPTFVFMLESMLEWCVDSRSAIQPNAKWELLSFEYAIEVVESIKNQMVGQDKDGTPQTAEISEDVQYLVIGMEFVDILGNEDVQYDMGRIRRQSESQLTPKMLRELLANQNSKIVEPQPSVEVESYKEKLQVQDKRLLDQDKQLTDMRTQMQTMQEMMAGLITELQTAKTSSTTIEKETPSKKVVKRKGK